MNHSRFTGCAARVRAIGGHAEVRLEELSHAQINAELGLQSEYSSAVDAFIRSVGAAGTAARP